MANHSPSHGQGNPDGARLLDLPRAVAVLVAIAVISPAFLAVYTDPLDPQPVD